MKADWTVPGRTSLWKRNSDDSVDGEYTSFVIHNRKLNYEVRRALETGMIHKRALRSDVNSIQYHVALLDL